MSKFTVNRQILTREVTVDGGRGGTVRCPTVRRYAATVTRGRVNNAAQRTVPSMGQRQDEPTNKETPIESARRYLAREQPKRERERERGALANLSGKREPRRGPHCKLASRLSPASCTGSYGTHWGRLSPGSRPNRINSKLVAI